MLAAPQGFEPQSAGPEPAVLPIERKGNYEIIHGHPTAVKRPSAWPEQAKEISIQKHYCGMGQWSPAVWLLFALAHPVSGSFEQSQIRTDRDGEYHHFNRA
jgi:hypothetical protein